MILKVTIIIILIMIIFILLIKNEKLENINSDIGNTICVYFVNVCFAFRDKKDFIHDNNTENILIQNLPKLIKYDPIIGEQLEKLPDGMFTIDLAALWVCENDNHATLWEIMKPLIKNTLDTTFKNMFHSIGHGKQIPDELISKHPVIHFRCSDVPFSKHPHYHFVKYSFYLEVLNNLKILDVDTSTVVILACFSHGASDENKLACQTYVDSLAQYLNKHGHQVNIKCGSNIDDFITLFYAAAVISTGSSYSFMSGFFGNGYFYSAGHGLYFVNESNESTCTKCDFWLKKNRIIMHRDIDSYYDTESVIKILEN